MTATDVQRSTGQRACCPVAVLRPVRVDGGEGYRIGQSLCFRVGVNERGVYADDVAPADDAKAA